jgi:site-specific recombinase XerD
MADQTVETTFLLRMTPSLPAISPNTELEHGSSFQKRTNRDRLALPEQLTELPDWQLDPFCRFLRLKQRNWPARTVRRATRQLSSRLCQMMNFFLQHHQWQVWEKLSLHWVDDYIDARLRQGISPATINWDLIHFRMFCRFLIDEGYTVPAPILRLKLLDIPRRLPRPLSGDQVRQLEQILQLEVQTARTDHQHQLAWRDLTCFYLLWHCGLRTSEVCSLLVNEADLGGGKLFIRDSKERKDRVVYISETATNALFHYLKIRHPRDVPYLFISQRGQLTPCGLQFRLQALRRRSGVPVTAQRLRHTFATQMLAAGMPITSLQRYLGHQELDTTMLYAEVADPLLRQDYYRGIAQLDSPFSSAEHAGLSSQHQLRDLLSVLKSPELDPTHQQAILDQIEQLLEGADERNQDV